ncbi:MAG: AbrB/MazE/SpoVT family DNA-binding domain-containing protein [Desulfobacteraceae bacterium]|nr:AbrB/MazE/SpoVT family DNA-binding domain-containing protein [Desulfobacteraceae bacterium]
MNTIMKISPQGQIRIPKKILQTLKISTGDYVEIDIENGQAVLKPRKLIDPSQGWFWTNEWQTLEKESDKAVEREETSPTFHSAEEGIEWLNE